MLPHKNKVSSASLNCGLAEFDVAGRVIFSFSMQLLVEPSLLWIQGATCIRSLGLLAEAAFCTMARSQGEEWRSCRQFFLATCAKQVSTQLNRNEPASFFLHFKP
jgi:hypothetical protein